MTGTLSCQLNQTLAARASSRWATRLMTCQVADRAVQIFGGRGYVRENVAERFFLPLAAGGVANGTYLAQPTAEAIAVAEELAGRFGLPLWRFANSGTEASMDAVHLMRAITGRPRIVKVEGCYHGTATRPPRPGRHLHRFLANFAAFADAVRDQEEALTMSDRLAVMAGGRIEQVGATAPCSPSTRSRPA